jgi:RimJ/RimL family protein N-acetyltransferase
VTTPEFASMREASIDDFLSVSAESPYQPQLRKYLASLLERGSTRPEWCFIAFAADAPVARAAFWALPYHDVPTDLVLIHADWSEDDLSAGHALLRHLRGLAGTFGVDALNHHVDTPPGPPQYQEDEEARVRLLERAGFALLRDGLRWRYSGASSPPPPGPLLVFQPLPEVGEDAFVEIMAATYESTKDSWITQNIEEHGLLGAARTDFREYEELEHQPEWWEVAYTEDGERAGVIIPASNPSMAVIGYVGIVPEHRGRGLASQLVRRGTEQLVKSGASEIGGDCDRGNLGMVKAFERAGYERVARRRTYQLAIAATR